MLEHGIEALDTLRFGEVDFVEQDPFAMAHGLGQHALDETESALGRGGEAPDQLARISGAVEIETADTLAQKMREVENGSGFGRRGFAFQGHGTSVDYADRDGAHGFGQGLVDDQVGELRGGRNEG